MLRDRQWAWAGGVAYSSVTIGAGGQISELDGGEQGVPLSGRQNSAEAWRNISFRQVISRLLLGVAVQREPHGVLVERRDCREERERDGMASGRNGPLRASDPPSAGPRGRLDVLGNHCCV